MSGIIKNLNVLKRKAAVLEKQVSLFFSDVQKNI